MSTSHQGPPAETIDTIRRAISGVRFGSVELTIHDSQIVQIERREKLRVENASTKVSEPKGGR